MTDLSPDTPEAQAAGTLDWADPSDLPLEEVRDVFQTLSKALRAYQLYDPSNPVYKRFVSNLRDSFLRIWTARDQLQVLIEEERLTWFGEEVYRNENRSDSLAFIFYRDGIRDITFKKGLEDAELERFLDALHRAKHVRDEADDLATILWDLDLQCLGYSAVDVGVESVEVPGSGAPGPLNAGAVLESEVGALPSPAEEEGGEGTEPSERRSAAPGTVNRDDFNPALYALGASELQQIRDEVQVEFSRDLRRDVLNALFDRLEEPERPDRQAEILGILRTLLPNFLSRGALVPAARIIEEVQRLQAQKGVLAEETLEGADRLLDELSSAETVDELIRALDDGTVAPDVQALSELLKHLRASALASLLKGAEEARTEEIRDLLREAIHGMAEHHKDVVIRLLSAPDPSVASGAVRLVGRMGLTEATGPLARLLEDGPSELRQVVVETAADVPSSALAGAVQRVLRDEDRELRVAAARVLGKTRYRPAASEFRDILESKELRNADVTEKVAFFEAYGLLAGEQAIGFLDKILNKKGFLGRREPPEIRAGAALALGKIGGPKARGALERALGEDDPVIRSAVGRAIKEEDSDAG